MDTLKLTEHIKGAPIEQIFGASRLEDLDWLWFHRDLFPDVILLADENIEEEDMDHFLRMLSDDDFIELLEPRMTEHGFVALSAQRFHKLQPEEKSFDEDTILFVSRRYLTKRMIRYANLYDWVLKSMALDLHGSGEHSLMEVYKEYFEDNGRILEQMALTGEFEQSGWTWHLEVDTDTLISSYEGKAARKWSSREALNAFDYKVRGGK